MYPETLNQFSVDKFQVDMAVKVFDDRFPMGELTAYHPFNLPDGFLRVKVEGRENTEGFILILAMILLGEAREGDKAELPAAVDSYDLLATLGRLRNYLEESDSDGEFFLTLDCRV